MELVWNVSATGFRDSPIIQFSITTIEYKNRERKKFSSLIIISLWAESRFSEPIRVTWQSDISRRIL
jgi:hypothetical protein